jgi:hypothetical protein
VQDWWPSGLQFDADDARSYLPPEKTGGGDETPHVLQIPNPRSQKKLAEVRIITPGDLDATLMVVGGIALKLDPAAPNQSP